MDNILGLINKTIYNTDITSDEKVEKIKNIIIIYNDITGLNDKLKTDENKKRKRYYYLRKKNQDNLKPNEKKELEDLISMGFGKKKSNEKHKNESLSESDNSDSSP